MIERIVKHNRCYTNFMQTAGRDMKADLASIQTSCSGRCFLAAHSTYFAFMVVLIGWAAGIKVNIEKSRGGAFKWNRNWDFCWIWANRQYWKKRVWADYEQLLMVFFSCFQGQFFFEKNVVVSALKSCVNDFKNTVESRFKKAWFKKESRFKKDCWYNRFFST